MHIPVLAREVIQAFEPRVKCYLDLTLGLGGHASMIAQRFRPGKMVGFDADSQMLPFSTANVRKVLTAEQEFTTHNANYSQVCEILPNKHQYDAVLMDLGVASPHFDDPMRGMSFMRDGPLDMRLNQTSQKLTAYDIVNTYTETQLGRIIQEYGEERHYRACARQIVASRNEQKIETTAQLVDILNPVLGPRRGASHPATKVFQALRIETNNELGHLKTCLPQVISKLLNRNGGRLAVISFHTLEDRFVKECFLEAKRTGLASMVSKKPIVATEEEIKANPRARSAKMRVLTCGVGNAIAA